MADILLLEPAYANKYPPIGLMKISYFHKYIQGDYVRFSKGPLPNELASKKWDRVYVTTLFTFEWEKTKATLEYALKIVKDESQVYTGGILATLMPELIAENFPQIKNNTGLLNKKGTLGLEREEEIDTLPLDYGILDDIDYVYPAHNAYFTYMTRGCGMKCGFCAVQTLEPTYTPYLSIKENIARIDREFGPKKDLLLMDNNVLRSPCFNQIVDEIIELGFGKGATYTNPKTKKISNRYVDFNQGLDAKLLTPEKAKRLGELAILPARIAFDHIEDKDVYIRAITLCAENGIDHMSNYLLYNGEDFSGKGSFYRADTPEDLYDRMRISLDLCEELSERLKRRITIFSFPMRYIPLSDLKRGYVGKNWNLKYLRAVQRMMIPTQGKGVASRSFFETDFGQTAKEFVEFLAMPEDILSLRGHFVEKKNETINERAYRYAKWEDNQILVNTWRKLYSELGSEKDEFVKVIGPNQYTYEVFKTLESERIKTLFVFYFTVSGLLNAIKEEYEAGKDDLSVIIKRYPQLYRRMIEHVSKTKVQATLITGLLNVFGKQALLDIVSMIDISNSSNLSIFDNLNKAQKRYGKQFFDFTLIKYYQLFLEIDAIPEEDIDDAKDAICNLQREILKGILIRNMENFKNNMIRNSKSEVASAYLIKQIEDSINQLYEQLSIFGEENE